MSNAAEYASDPLQRTMALDHSGAFSVLGCALEVRSNSAAVLDAAATSWGEAHPSIDANPIRLFVAVSPSSTRELPPEPTFRGQLHLSTITCDRENFASVDSARGLSCIWVTETTAADAEFLRWFFLEAAAYLLLAEQRFTPLHAGCVAREGRGVLLLGPSGAGKSTLSYTCARRGWTFVSDDAAWLLRESKSLRVLGPPPKVRLLPDASERFEELAGRKTARSLGGKSFVEFDLIGQAGIKTALECEAAACIFLHRDGTKEARFSAVPAEVVYGLLADVLVRYDDPARAEQLASLKRLAQIQSFDLHYQEAEAAAEALETLVL